MNQELAGFGQPPAPDFKRLLLAGLLMSVLLFAFNGFFGPSKTPAPEKPLVEEIQKAEKPSEPDVLVQQPAEPLLQATEPTVPLIPTEFEVAVSNEITERDAAWPKGGYLLTSENLGAKISSLAVFGYKEPINLLEGRESGLFLLNSRTKALGISESSPYEIISSGPREIVYQRVTAGGLKVTRRYHFESDNYLIRHVVEVQNLSQIHQKLDLDLLFKTEGKIAESSYFSGSVNEFNFLAFRDGSIERHAQNAVLEKPIVLSGPTDFFGLEQRYFLVSVLPQNPTQIEAVSAKARSDDKNKTSFQSEVTVSLKSAELAPLEATKWEFQAYVGPKQIGLLKLVKGRGLEEAVNFGWFGIVSRPLLWLLVEIYDLVHNFGFAIILLTLLIKLLTFPLTQKSFVSMQQVKKIGPEIKELQKKYGHDRTLLSQKQMELYKEKGVNPMAGCLPMFLQFPIWIGLYQMLNNSVEIYQKPFAAWLTDLTQPDPYYVLPVLMGISMVIQQLLQPVQDDQKAMKYAMLGTSLLFTFIMISLPSGLSLYMLTNNILTVIQQIVIKKRFDSQTA